MWCKRLDYNPLQEAPCLTIVASLLRGGVAVVPSVRAQFPQTMPPPPRGPRPPLRPPAPSPKVTAARASKMLRTMRGQALLQPGAAAAVSSLLAQGASPDARAGGHNASPRLVEASRVGAWDVVEVLLQAGASANTCARGQRSALHYACLRGNATLASDLLTRGADVNAAAGPERYTPLCDAAGGGHAAAVRACLAAGAVTSPDHFHGTCPLAIAAAAGAADCLTALLEAGSPVDWTSPEQWGLLAFAAAGGSVACLKALCAAGCQVHCSNAAGKSLHVAVGHAEPAFAAALVQLRPQSVLSDSSWRSQLLHCAVQRCHVGWVQWLTATFQLHCTPLMPALPSGQTPLQTLLCSSAPIKVHAMATHMLHGWHVSESALRQCLVDCCSASQSQAAVAAACLRAMLQLHRAACVAAVPQPCEANPLFQRACAWVDFRLPLLRWRAACRQPAAGQTCKEALY